MVNAQIFWRGVALLIAAVSAASMLYVGLYQNRFVGHLICPVTGYGCQAVADAPFAHPFGIPDGLLAAALYAVIGVLLLAPAQRAWVRTPLLGLAILAMLANAAGVQDMINFGSFCFYCLLTTITSPVLLWAIWAQGKQRSEKLPISTPIEHTPKRLFRCRRFE